MQTYLGHGKKNILSILINNTKADGKSTNQPDNVFLSTYGVSIYKKKTPKE
jgi:hypothetical protein